MPYSRIYFDPIRRSVIDRGSKRLPDATVETWAKGLFAEAILLGDEIVIGIWGPNLELVTLVRWLGDRLTEQLISDGTISFVFTPGMFAYMGKKFKEANKMKAGPGLEWWTGVGKEWEEPREATVFALVEQLGFSRQRAKQLGDLVGNHTVTTESSTMYDDVRLTSHNDMRSALGANFGFDGNNNPDSGDIPDKTKHKYLALAHANAVLCLTSSMSCNDIIADDMCSNVLEHRCAALLRPGTKSVNALTQILRFEEIPDVTALLNTGAVSFDDIVELRASDDVRAFRKWFSKMQPESSKEVIRAYCSAISDCLSTTVPYKVLKVAVFTAISAAISAIDPIAGAGTGATLELVEMFLAKRFVDKLWDPRMIVSSLESMDRKTSSSL